MQYQRFFFLYLISIFCLYADCSYIQEDSLRTSVRPSIRPERALDSCGGHIDRGRCYARSEEDFENDFRELSGVEKVTSGVQNWYRGDSCVANSSSWNAEFGPKTDGCLPPFLTEDFWSTFFPSRTQSSTVTPHVCGITSMSGASNPFNCCGNCKVLWSGVRIVHWQHPGSDDSCLSEVDHHGLSSKILEIDNGANIILSITVDISGPAAITIPPVVGDASLGPSDAFGVEQIIGLASMGTVPEQTGDVDNDIVSVTVSEPGTEPTGDGIQDFRRLQSVPGSGSGSEVASQSFDNIDPDDINPDTDIPPLPTPDIENAESMDFATEDLATDDLTSDNSATEDPVNNDFATDSTFNPASEDERLVTTESDPESVQEIGSSSEIGPVAGSDSSSARENNDIDTAGDSATFNIQDLEQDSDNSTETDTGADLVSDSASRNDEVTVLEESGPGPVPGSDDGNSIETETGSISDSTPDDDSAVPADMDSTITSNTKEVSDEFKIMDFPVFNSSTLGTPDGDTSSTTIFETSTNITDAVSSTDEVAIPEQGSLKAREFPTPSNFAQAHQHQVTTSVSASQSVITHVSQHAPSVSFLALRSPGKGTGEESVSSVVYDGKTYISPSIYLEMTTLQVRDKCALDTTVSGYRTSLHPDDVYTIVPNDMACWAEYFYNAWANEKLTPDGCVFSTQRFDFAHLPCPPKSLRERYSSAFIYNPRFSYAPILAPITELASRLLAPLSSVYHSSLNCEVMYGWDPPTALVQASSMPTDHVSIQAELHPPHAAPGSTTQPRPLQTQTGLGQSNTDGQAATVASEPVQASIQIVTKGETAAVAVSKASSAWSTGPSWFIVLAISIYWLY